MAHDSEPFFGVSYNCREIWWKNDFSLEHLQCKRRTRPCIFGSWGEHMGCLIRSRVQCPVNHPSKTSQESLRISAWLFPVHHVPFQCSYQDLDGFGIKERNMLKDWQLQAQKIWKGEGVVGTLFVLKSRRCSWPDGVSLKKSWKTFWGLRRIYAK